MKTKTAIARQDVPACLVWDSPAGIQKGETRQIKRRFWYNGEGWYRFTDGTQAPDIFFDEARQCAS